MLNHDIFWSIWICSIRIKILRVNFVTWQKTEKMSNPCQNRSSLCERKNDKEAPLQWKRNERGEKKVQLFKNGKIPFWIQSLFLKDLNIRVIGLSLKFSLNMKKQNSLIYGISFPKNSEMGHLKGSINSSNF